MSIFSTEYADAPILPYTGSSPLCYTNTLVMCLQDPGISPSLVETLTGSAFGYQLLGGSVPFCDPYGWDPEEGTDQALRLLGYEWETRDFPTAEKALAGLRTELQRRRPVFVGPVDMGLLAHQPGSDRANGADHYVAVLDVTDDQVWMHDPQGHPWAALPVDLFLDAWRADEIAYVKPYTLRCAFTRVEAVEPTDALRALMAEATAWAQGRHVPTPPGTLGGTEALSEIADRCDDGLDEDMRGVLVDFSLRLGARRRQDAAMWLAHVGDEQVATNLQIQSRILGGMQYPTMVRQWRAVADQMRTLASTHADLIRMLSSRH